MIWLIIVILAHLLNAVVFMVDKYLLGGGRIGRPSIYAFYVGLLGLVSVVLIPFGGIVLPSLGQLAFNLGAGAIFVISLLIFYKAISVNEASRAVPLVGSFQILFIFFLSYLFLGERLEPRYAAAFLFLLAGSLLISWRHTRNLPKMTRKALWAIAAAFSFAIFFVMTKHLYLHQPFVSAFVWSRFGGAIVAFCLLLKPAVRNEVFKKNKTSQTKKIVQLGQFLWTRMNRGTQDLILRFFPRAKKILFKNKPIKRKIVVALFFSNQALSAISFILINLAIALASVTLVNALQGIQYVFIFLLAWWLSRHTWFIVEVVNRDVIFQKIIAIILIVIGIFLLA